MKEQLISFSTAKLAREKGFDVSSWFGNDVSLYNKKGEHVYYANYGMYGSGLSDGYIKAPTQSLLQKWLREEHNIDIYIRGYGFGYYPSLNNVPPANQTVHYVDRRWNLTNKEDFTNLVTYEEALEKGLIEALKLINK